MAGSRRGCSCARRASSSIVPVTVLLAWERAVIHDHRLSIGWPAVRDERVEQTRELLRSRVADDGAIEPREARPVDVGEDAVLVLVSAHQRDRVAAARIGHRDAGIRRHPDAERNTGHDLERNALLVQEQRFLASAIEDERVAPFQPRHELAFARFLDEQEC